MNDNRPADFDARLLAYTPFIRKKANRWCALHPSNGEPEDFIQDVMAEALRRGATYSKNYAFGTWIRLICSHAIARRKRGSGADKRAAGRRVAIDAAASVSTPAPQQAYAELSETLRNLSGTRDSEILLRIAMGDELHEIGDDLGLSKERVRQLKVRELSRLRELMGEARRA